MTEKEKIGPLKEWKHEAYAQARATGASLGEASLAAGLSGHRGNGHQLEVSASNGNVAARILELRTENFKETDIDSFFITGCLAKEAVDPTSKSSSRVTALKTLADIAGMRGQRFKGDEGIMSREERDALLIKLLAAAKGGDLGPLVDVTPEPKSPNKGVKSRG